MVTRAEDTRERILFGAEEVVLRDGVAHLTLETAASEAGISKGGVLYHFPTRAALVAAMVQRLSSMFDADLERAGGSSNLRGAFTKSYVEATFGPPSDEEASRDRRLGAAVIAGVAADTELLEPLRERFAVWQHALVTDGLPPAVASLVRLAADGLWFTELLGLAPLDHELRSSVRDELLELVDSTAPPVKAIPPARSARVTATGAPVVQKNADMSMGVPSIPAGRVQTAKRIVVALSISTFVEWAGAGSVLPLLPLYLRKHGAPVALVGVAMSAFFFAAVFVQYPIGRLSDRVGRRPIQIGGLLTYSAAERRRSPSSEPRSRLCSSARCKGSGRASSTSPTTPPSARLCPPRQQGRAYGAVFGARLMGLSLGPIVGGVVGLGGMRWLFLGAAFASLLACLPILLVVPKGRSRVTHAAAPKVVLWRNRSVLGVALGYGANGVIIGVYEVCWSLLLHLQGATAWQIGFSWTLFAIPFAAMSLPGGWLVDHLDRRYLAAGATLLSAGFAATYPFLHSIWLLIGVSSLEATAVAVAGARFGRRSWPTVFLPASSGALRARPRRPRPARPRSRP